MKLRAGSILIALSALCRGAQFQNGSFELGINPNSDLLGGSSNITGWVITGTAVAWVGGDGAGNLPSDGTLFVDLNGCIAGSSPNCIVQGGIQQTFDTTVGTTYAVTFDMNTNNDPSFGAPGPSSVQVSAGGVSQKFTYTQLPTACSPFNCKTPWQTFTFTFTSISGQTTLAFSSVSPQTQPGPEIDNIKIAVAAPLYNVCLLYDPSKAVNSGATLPVKLQLCDKNGSNLSSSTITLHATGTTQSSTSISGSVQDSGNANPDNDFRFDPAMGSTGGYIFNLSTKGLSTGTYTLSFTATGDSSMYSASFQVK